MKKIKGYDNYYITIEGNVYNINTKRYLKPQIRNGYLFYSLWDKGSCKNVYIHRLIALYYLDNEHNLPQVNHIDGNKLNNNISNLEWVTNKQNTIHAWSLGLCENSRNASILNKSKIVLDTINGIFYSSAKEAANLLGYNPSTLMAKLNGRLKNNTNLMYV